MPAIPNDRVDALRQNLRGTVLTPTDAGYDAARTIWNAMCDKRPALMVQCAGVADVVAAVNFARDNGLQLAVRGGGHNIAGSALCDDGLVIDFSRMRSVQINLATRRAYVEPGATLGDFDHEALAVGLATPLGINSTTGVAGLTLGGGFGWLSRKYGMTVDNLVSCDVVTADGQRLLANQKEHPDLFWALRGGGGNFGVVTLFEFRLHTVGPDVLAGLIVFPADEAKSVLRKYRAFVDTMPDELSVWVVLRKAPPLPFLPSSVHGTDILALPVFYAGDPAQGQALLAPVHAFGTPLGAHVGVMPYTAWQKMFDPLLGPGARNYWKSHNFATLPDEAIDAMVDYAARLPSPLTDIFIGLIGGQASRVAPDAMAYHHRDARFVMNVHARWERPDEDQACIAWARDFFRVTEPFASGSVYVNFLTEEEGGRIGAAYGPNYARLAQIKQTYDPQNLFRANQNIAPASGS